MELVYNLSEIVESAALKELKLELAPRNQCRNYIQKNDGKAALIIKKDFDLHYKNKEFLDGPFTDTFGDCYGEPYNPNRQAFGKLKIGKVVYCELSDVNQKKTTELLKSSLSDKLTKR